MAVWRAAGHPDAAISGLSSTYGTKAQLPFGAGGGRLTRLTIMIYHAITLGSFQTDLDYYQEWNYTTVTPDDIAAHLAGTATLPEKPIMITFDDGYDSQHAAAQELNTRGMKGVFYIRSGFIDGTTSGASFSATGTAATWAQIQQWLAWGHSIQGHTLSHLDQATLTPAQVAADFTGTKARIEAQVPGSLVRHMAYPYGSWTDATIAALKGAGCLTARVVKIGMDGKCAGPNLGVYAIASTGMDPLALPTAGANFGPIFQVNCQRRVTDNDELMPDFGFEGGGKGWSLGTGSTVVTTTPYAGTKCLQMTEQTSTISSSLTRIIPVGPYTSVLGAVKIKTAGLPAGTLTKVQVQTLKADGTTVIATTDAVTVTGNNGAWTEYTFSYVGTSDAAYLKVYTWLQGNGTPTGTALFDNLSVRRQTVS